MSDHATPEERKELLSACENLRRRCSGESELSPARGSAASDWKEATEAAEAWCQIRDEEGRNHAIYCYRAGYLKAKRQNAKVSDAPDSAAPNRE